MMRTVIGVLLVVQGLLVPSVARAQSEQVFYYYEDAIGSVRMITDATGQVVEWHDYQPFGEESLINPQTPERRLYTGKERDAETNYDYSMARYYAGINGRFTTVDPGHVAGDIFNPQTWNGYTYALNNPLRYADSSGYASECANGMIDTGDGCVSGSDFRFWWDSVIQSWSSAIQEQRAQTDRLADQIRTDPTFQCGPAQGCFASSPFVPRSGRLTGLIGRSFGRTGRIVADPRIAILGFRGSVVPGHAINQIINRGVTPQLLRSIVENPLVVLEQAGGRYLYLTGQGAVVITKDGQVVTAYTVREFLPHIWQVLKTVSGQ